MIRRTRFIVPAFSILSFFAGITNAETLQEVQQKIHDKVSSYKTIQFTAKMATTMDASGFKMKSDSEQKAAYQRKDAQTLSRIETKMKSTQTVGDQTQTMESTSLDISDGKFAYNLTDSMGQKMASRRTLDPKSEYSPFDVMRGFKQVAETYDLKLLPDQKVDGKAVWVIEMTMKPSAHPELMGKTVSYYDKDTGVSVKSVTYDAKGAETTVLHTTNVKIDGAISPDQFVFKAPEGVEVKDMSMNMGGAVKG